jgi:hypothetical protein
MPSQNSGKTTVREFFSLGIIHRQRRMVKEMAAAKFLERQMIRRLLKTES